jgi:hypothetical protein
MDKWEYKSLKFEVKGFFGGVLDTEQFDSVANKHGQEGWELVSCFDTNYAQGGSRYIIAVFKKRILTRLEV